MTEPFDAIVLAGGTARRMGGVDKATLRLGERTLLDRVLLACGAARTTVVVGPRRTTSRPVLWTVEQPPGSGPLSAVDAGLTVLGRTPPRVPVPLVVLATDLAFLTSTDVDRLVRGVYGHGACVLVDGRGRRQPLAAAYARPALDDAIAALGDPRDRAVRLLLDLLDVAELPDRGAAYDCDTPDDLAGARERWRTEHDRTGSGEPR